MSAQERQSAEPLSGTHHRGLGIITSAHLYHSLGATSAGSLSRKRPEVSLVISPLSNHHFCLYDPRK